MADWEPGRSAEDVAAERVRYIVVPGAANVEFPAWVAGERITARFVRPHGEQPEPMPLSPSASCPFCEQYPCTNRVHFVERFRTQ